MRFLLSFFMLMSALIYGQTDRTILYAQATEYGYRNQFKEAEKVLSQIIALYPNDSMAYFDRAIMRENYGDTIGAIADFTKEIEINQKSADNYFLRGMLYHKTKMYNEALLDFKKVNQLDAGNADSHYYTAQLLLDLQKNKFWTKRQLKYCLRINSTHEEAKKLMDQIG